MTCVVRQGIGADVEAARALTNRSWRATYAPLIGARETEDIIAERHCQGLFDAQARLAGHLFLVAERCGDIVGHCYAYPKGGVYVDRLHVEPRLKGGGIGRAMLGHVEAGLPAGTRVWLEVLEGNQDAAGFYQRLGYTPAGRTDACGGIAGVPAISFVKTLCATAPNHS